MTPKNRHNKKDYMATFKIFDFKDALTDDLKELSQWIIAYIEPSMAWSVSVQKITYLGQDFWIIPITNDSYPAVVTKANGENNQLTRERILRFLSVISWIYDSGISLISFGGGSCLYPYTRHKSNGFIIGYNLDFRYLPEIKDEKAKLALALMREARSLTHIAYSFLTYWRVLEVAIGKNKIQSWIEEAKTRLLNQEAKKVIKNLQRSTDAIGKHLYESGRCAIAHALEKPIIDPDKPEHSWRLSQEIPLVEALAVLAIEKNLGVQTSYTITKEHLYELNGFKEILGKDFIDIILGEKEASSSTGIHIPAIDIGLMNKDPFPALQRLLCSKIQQEQGSAHLTFERPDRLLCVQFRLNFLEERLEFDIHNAIFGPPDDNSSAWSSIQSDLNNFLKWYYLNGCLIMTNADTKEIIARKDAFIPINCFLQPEILDRENIKWQEITKQRQEIENRISSNV